MSVKVMTWVWDYSRSKKSERLVLLAIADCASEDGSNAYPSMAELVRKTGLSERAVQVAIGGLVKLGELFVDRNAGPRGCNRYRVIMTTPAGSAPPQDLHPAGNAGVQEMHPAASAPLPQDVHPADPAPPQILRETPADSAPGTVLEPSEKNSSSKSSSARKRGTRIPADFAVDDSMRTWAYGEAADVLGRDPDHPKLDVWLNRWTAEFIDYWTSRSGREATKVDWTATWRNRMRVKLEQAAQQIGQPGNALAVRNGHNGTQPYVGTKDRKVAQVDLAFDSFTAKTQNGGG